MAQTTSTHMVTFGDCNTDCGNIKDSFNITVYNSDEDSKVMRWLSPLEPDSRHHSVRTNRLEGVGNWLFETSEFRDWRGGEGGADKAVLFCFGDPGVGKTHLSSLVIDRLCDQARQEGLVVAWFYCDYNAQQEQTVANMMGAILRRLVGREIPSDIREAFRGGRRPLLPDLVRMLKIAIASSPKAFICIDALDECQPKSLLDLLYLLADVVRESPTARIFLTGRPYVWEHIERYFAKAVAILISPSQDDVRSYVVTRLDGDDIPEAMNDGLRAEIVRTVLDKMSNIFLLASLNIEAILGEVTIGQRRRKLGEMARGNGLGDAYTVTLRRLLAQKGTRPFLGLKALMWVLYSERPLRAEELCHALGVERGSTDLDPETIPALRTLLSSCLGLLKFEASSSIVRLVHFTLKEYLSSDPTLFRSSHSAIAEACLTYLNFKSVRDLSLTLDSAPSTMPLLEYASFYWGVHTKRGMTQKVKLLAQRFFEIYLKGHISIQLLKLNKDKGLGKVALRGMIDAIAATSEAKEFEVNLVAWAESRTRAKEAVRGQGAKVKELSACGDVNHDQVDSENGGTPLAFAVMTGREEVVRMLLEQEDVNLSQGVGGVGLVLLTQAAMMGRDGVVRMLLEREDVDPNQAGIKDGWTPLMWAALMGREGVVKTLLEHEDIDPDLAHSQDGRTPLSFAAENGYAVVVQMLLQRKDVNPDRANTISGQTPLLFAAANGHEAVVQMLLQREDVNPNHVDTKYGQAPLTLAAKNGHEGVVKMLLERKDINPDLVDSWTGRTPLSWAAMNGNEGVAKMLLERKDVNPDVDTENGRTPLSLAAGEGNEGIVRILLERKDVNPNLADHPLGQTPLLWAASNGHEGVVKILLEREDLNPDPIDNKYGRTPLSWAAKHGHEGVVRMLLERNGVLHTRLDKWNQDPLSLAVLGGHDGVVRILREWNDVGPGKADHSDQASPVPSAWPTDESAAETQLRSPDPDTDDTDFNGQPEFPPVARARRLRLFDPEDSISGSTDPGPSAHPPRRPRLLSIRPRTIFHRLRKTKTRPDNQ